MTLRRPTVTKIGTSHLLSPLFFSSLEQISVFNDSYDLLFIFVWKRDCTKLGSWPLVWRLSVLFR